MTKHKVVVGCQRQDIQSGSVQKHPIEGFMWIASNTAAIAAATAHQMPLMTAGPKERAAAGTASKS
jgi:hypothetical protein